MKKRDYKQMGIKYKVIKLNKDKYILFPVSVEIGFETDKGFQAGDEIVGYLNSKKSLKNKFVMNYIYDCDEINYLCDIDKEEDELFLSEYFFDDFKDTIIFIDAKNGNELKQFEINLNSLLDENLTFFMKNNIPSLALNEKSINEILKTDDLNTIKLNLLRLKRLILSFKDVNEEKDITRINVVQGHVDYIDVAKKKIYSIEDEFQNIPEKDYYDENVSYVGLRNYIKERVFGHDEEIDKFALKLFMNYTAEKGDAISSILFVGPTGTGKTQTIKAACEYLNIPSVITSAPNLVTEGIKGVSIEDCLASLYKKADEDLNLAQRGIIFFDEFDKLSNSDLDTKKPIKDILLSFNDGAEFNVNNELYQFMFDTTYLNKIYAGVFERIGNVKNQIGFNKNDLNFNNLTSADLRKRIIETGYYSEEDLSRISSILKYSALDKETKRKILLSKYGLLQKKLARYKRQFNADITLENDFIDTLLEKIDDTGSMRNLNNMVEETLDGLEQYLLEENNKKIKKINLTKDTVLDKKKFN